VLLVCNLTLQRDGRLFAVFLFAQTACDVHPAARFGHHQCGQGAYFELGNLTLEHYHTKFKVLHREHAANTTAVFGVRLIDNYRISDSREQSPSLAINTGYS
jgi:hypothetical protein